MIAYKIVEKTEDGNYKFLFHNRKTPIEFCKEIQAEKKMVYESYNRNGTKKEYMSGIHVIETPELCIKYLQRFKDLRNKAILVCEAEGCVPKPKGNPGVLLADKIMPLRELGNEDYIRGEIVVATYGYNSITKRPFEFLYDFGYYTYYGCVVYNQEERNIQDSHAFKLYQIRRATEEDKRKRFWGN